MWSLFFWFLEMCSNCLDSMENLLGRYKSGCQALGDREDHKHLKKDSSVVFPDTYNNN